MTLDERKRIDFLLQLGRTPVQIAKEMGRSKTTIIREIINRSVACDRGYRCSNRICANFDVCSRPKGYGANPDRLFRCTAGCDEVCRDFVERTCERLDVPSRVCNGCRDSRITNLGQETPDQGSEVKRRGRNASANTRSMVIERKESLSASHDCS